MRWFGYLMGTAIMLPVLLGSLFRSSGLFIHDIYWAQEWLGGDRMTHALMGGSLWLALSFILGFRRQVYSVAGSLALLLFDELIQLYLPTREFSFDDLLFGVIGLSIASLSYLILKHRLLGCGGISFLSLQRQLRNQKMVDNQSDPE